MRYVPDGADGGPERLEVEADARHADILIRELGFDKNTKGCEVPEDKPTQADLIETERQPALDEKQASSFRSMVMRMAYLSVDRPDLCHAVRALAGAMSKPKMNDLLRLKKVVRYLVSYPYMKRTFQRQLMEKMTVGAWSDSDWAGELKTRRSTTGTVLKIGAPHDPHQGDEPEGGGALELRERVLCHVQDSHFGRVRPWHFGVLGPGTGHDQAEGGQLNGEAAVGETWCRDYTPYSGEVLVAPGQGGREGARPGEGQRT